MPRTARIAPAGMVFHVLNRAAGRRKIFRKPADYAAFERVLALALEAVPVRLFAYCLMPNHWHLLVAPQRAGQLAAFMARLTMTHVRRWQSHRNEIGQGHLYQGRFKSFPVEDDLHFLTVARYIERNPLRARLVTSAADWPWSSLARYAANGSPSDKNATQPALAPHSNAEFPLAPWPVARPADWLRRVDAPQSDAELDALRTSVRKGRPYGDAPWQATIIRRLGLESTLRNPGRPRKPAADQPKRN